jgi:hypothetical protein
MIDVWLEVALLSFILGALAPSLFKAGGPFSADKSSKNLVGWFLLPIAMILDAALYALLGNSLGKAILGIRVRSADGPRLTFGRYLQRNLSMYLGGLGTGFPLVSLFTLASSHKCASRHELMSWDKQFDSRPISSSGIMRTMVGALCVTALFCGVVALSTFTRSSTQQRVSSANHTVPSSRQAIDTSAIVGPKIRTKARTRSEGPRPTQRSSLLGLYWGDE